MKTHDAYSLFYFLTSITTCSYSIKVIDKQRENQTEQTPSDAPQLHNLDETPFNITDFIPKEPGNSRVPKSDHTFSDPVISSNITEPLSINNVENPKKYLRTQSGLQYNATRALINSHSQSNAAWMSGHHGLSYTLYGGFNVLTFLFNVNLFIRQLRGLLEYGVKWFILNLSSPNSGDTYTAPHIVLSNINRGSTPRIKPGGGWRNGDRPLETFSHRDLFREIMVGLDSIGVKTIAYMSAQGPAMLLSGEGAAYDYNNRSPYVDSCRFCPSLTNTKAPFCECAPSVWQWKKHVLQKYNSTDDDTMKRAYAEIIVGEYARKYGEMLAGFVFDQAHQADISIIHDVIKEHIPNAVLAFNKGQSIPLNNNNPPYEDFTFGLPSYVNTRATSCKNYPMITSLEDTVDGFFYENNKGSLGHIHTPLNEQWSNGDDVWKLLQAREWQSRVMAANGAWTWNVKRARSGENSLIDEDDLHKLERIYKNLSMKYPYKFDCGIPYYKPSTTPTNEPSVTWQPSSKPSRTPSAASNAPSVTLSQRPSLEPSTIPTNTHSIMPSITHSRQPSIDPSSMPTNIHSIIPSVTYSQRPSFKPSAMPTNTHSIMPSKKYSPRPSLEPSTIPTNTHSIMPSITHSRQPSLDPSSIPTNTHTTKPSVAHSEQPSSEPSTIPTNTHSIMPSVIYSQIPSSKPSIIPTTAPSIMPSITHSRQPSLDPSTIPTNIHSIIPSVKHSQRPSSQAFAMATTAPSFKPSRIPTSHPSSIPSMKRSHNQLFKTSEEPSYMPLATPSNIFTSNPSVIRSQGPSFKPLRIPTSHLSPMLSIKNSQNPSFKPSSLSNTPSKRPFQEQLQVSTTVPSILLTMLSIDDKSQEPSIPSSPKPSIHNSQEQLLMPSKAPSNEHSTKPSITKLQNPSFKIPAIPTVRLSSIPSIPKKSNRPSSGPSTLPSISISSTPSIKRVVVPSFIPSKKYNTSLKHFTSFKETFQPTFNSTYYPTYNQTWVSTTSVTIPSSSPTHNQINDLPSLMRSDSHHNASWMSGHHGISFQISGGVNYLSSYFDVDAFIQQIMEISQSPDYGIRWVIINLSSSNTGDRYLAPHSVLTRINRGSTSKKIPDGKWENGNILLEQYEDRDLFGEILDGLDSIGVKTVAYMAAQGPALLQWGEKKAYDYNNKSPYVDSCALCPSLTNTEAPFCGCAPSVWRWRNYVLEEYNSVVGKALKRAYAEIIVGEYASRYGEKLAGYVFDQVQNYHDYDIKQIHDAIRTHNKKAVLAFNRGQRIPLKNNNAPYEDFTYGYPKDLRYTEASSCENFPAITSIETALTGFLYEHGKESLGHIHTPINERWTSGGIVWSMERAQKWQSRMITANGAWTWGVRLGKRNDHSVIRNDDMMFLKKLYKGLGDHSNFEDDCELPELIESISTSSLQRNDPTNTRSPSLSDSVSPSITPNPSSKTSKGVKKAEWMSGHHGISFRISGGVSYISSFYDVNAFIQQFTNSLLDYGIRWVIVNLSHSHRGDRYLAPHSVLTNMNRGSTPKAVPRGSWRNDIDMPLEQYDDRDLFGEILDGLDSIGVKTIAYMASQGPIMAEWGEKRAYDYNNKSPYVDSCALCPSLTNTQGPFCGCAPSVWQWKRYVSEQYSSADDNALKKAYAEKIVGEYASRYGERLAGFAFDQVSHSYADISLLESNVRAHNPLAVLSYETEIRIPLQHNSYPYEDFTFGYPNDLRYTLASSCNNYPAITSIETTRDGFLYENGKGSLGHVHTPINKSWFTGDIVWNIEQAQEWQSRMMNAKGAWTWGVTLGIGKHFSLLSLYDVEFLERVYEGLRDGGPYVWTCG